MRSSSTEPARASEVEPYLRGCAWPAADWAVYPRCDPGPAGARLPADTRAQAALPVGVRLEFTGDAEAVQLDYCTATAELGPRGAGAGTTFALYRGSKLVAEAPALLGRGTVRLAAGAGPSRGIVYLPEGMRPVVRAIRAIGGEIAPATPQRRWLCYGDSIAEGWCAAGPAGAWPARAGRDCELDVVNLGYAGGARGELASAEEIAKLPADVISISHGTNCWTRTPHDAPLFRAGLASFLAIVRQQHPALPIVAVSPVLRPDAESTCNRLGTTLADLRFVFEDVVRERTRGGDARITLVPGLPLLPAERFADGVHPDDEGHARLAAALGPLIRAACERAAREDGR
ncbi:MAG TPA: GDSL-type esterase/lipase family protein [Myxococcota bacterium]|nr:GDSL-type esterase/lipase family protein [Myxococcota bacterium]